MMTVGERIKAKRIESGMTQAELAKRLNCTYQLISRYEHNVVDNIPMERIKAIAAALMCSPYELMEGVKEEPNLTAHQLRLIARIKAASPEEARKIEEVINLVMP